MDRSALGKIDTELQACRTAGLKWTAMATELGLPAPTLRMRAARSSAKPETKRTRRVTVADLARSVAPLVSSLREDGMSWESIAAELSAAGLAIKPTTLRIYLSGSLLKGGMP